MNRMPVTKKAQILGLLVEGMSLRAVSRVADCSINTVTKLLVDVGTACAEYQDKALHNLPCKRVQCDEIWSFSYAKQKHVKFAKAAAGAAGDVWTWTGIDADSKLIDPARVVTARPPALAPPLRRRLRAIPIPTTSARHLSSARTSPCVCRCAGSPG